MNIADRATPCARAPLTGADLGRRTFMPLQSISRCSIRKDAERTKGENREDAKHGEVFPRPRLITAQTPDQGAVGQSARVSKRWRNAFTMTGSHGSAEAATTSVASIKSASQTVLGSAPGKVERSVKIPISASNTRRTHEPGRC